MTDDFDQQCGMPIAAVILLNAANGEKVELPEFQAYSDFDLDRVQTQFSMLPDLIRIRNTVPLMKVTNVRRISQMLSEVHVSKTVFTNCMAA